jgi:hypothetical protein
MELIYTLLGVAIVATAIILSRTPDLAPLRCPRCRHNWYRRDWERGWVCLNCDDRRPAAK